MLKAQISKLKESKGFRKYFANTSWLMGGKFIQMGISFLVTAQVAQYLQPEGFGDLNYGKAIVQFLILFVAMGMNGINIRNLVEAPEKKGIILGTAWLIRAGSGLFFALLAIGVVFLLPEGVHDDLTNTLIFIMAFSTLFKSFDTFDEYFQSQVKAQYGVISRFTATMLFAGFQLYLIWIKADIIWFGLAFLLRNIIQAISYFSFYVTNYGWPRDLKLEIPYLKQLMTDAWPLIISSMVIFFYMKADQAMLFHLTTGPEGAGKAAVGQYTAALRVSEVWFMFGPILTGSLFPAIINARKKGEKAYYKRLQNFFDLMVWLAFGITIPMVLFGPSILQWNWLFGPRYAEAGGVLVIHCWTLVFVFLGNASAKYLIAENLQKLTLYRTLVGAVVNIILNLILIPRYGVNGAAVATLISQAVASYLSYAFHPLTKRIFGMMTQSLLLITLFRKLTKKQA